MAHSSGSGDAPDLDEQLVDARVIDAAGREASIVSIQHADDGPQAWIRLDQGTQVLVPFKLLTPQADRIYRLPFSFDIPAPGHPAQMTFPVMEEEPHVGRRVIDTGRGVRVHKTVSEREQVLDQPLLRDELEVAHVPVGRMIDDADAPQARYEGDTLVVPVLEEVLVVQKRLLLKEEVRITRHRRPASKPQSVRLRAEQVTVERFDEGKDRQA